MTEKTLESLRRQQQACIRRARAFESLARACRQQAQMIQKLRNDKRGYPIDILKQNRND